MHKSERVGKRKFRFNIIDLILLMIILAATAVMIYLLLPSRAPDGAVESQTVNITYSLTVKEVPEGMRGRVQVGDDVVDAVTLYNIGQVSDVSYVSSVFAGVNQTTGEYVYSELPGHIDVTVKVNATAVKTDTGITVNGFTVAVGKKIPFRVPGFTSEAYCTALEETFG